MVERLSVNLPTPHGGGEAWQPRPEGPGPLRDLLTLGLAGSAILLLLDEMGGFVDGANDNASAVACTLGIGQQAVQTPLRHT